MRNVSSVIMIGMALVFLVAGCGQDGQRPTETTITHVAATGDIALGEPDTWDYTLVRRTLDGYARMGLSDATLLELGYVLGGDGVVHIISVTIRHDPEVHIAKLSTCRNDTTGPGNNIRVTWSKVKKAYH